MTIKEAGQAIVVGLVMSIPFLVEIFKSLS